MSVIARILHAVTELALPGGCCGCGAYLQSGEGPWCTECALALGRAAQQRYCPRCGLTSDQSSSSSDGCSRCMTSRSFSDGFARIGEYDGLIRSLICQYKFGHLQYLDKPLGRFLATALQVQAWACELDGLVPVPISWRSRLNYRFSPPAALAQQVGAALNMPVLPLLFERGKRRRQVGLTPAERRRNVRGAFRLRRGARPGGGIFCVIDDVSTTGATIQEVTRVLKKAGATRVYAAVLARTNPDRAHTLQA